MTEKLVRDGFVKREKKRMTPTEDGVKLITVLTDSQIKSMLEGKKALVKSFQHKVKLEFLKKWK